MFKWLAKANLQISPSSSGFRTPFLPTPEAAKNDEEKRVLASAGKEIDSQVAEAAAAGATAKKRGSYHQYDGETRAKIARYACEHGQTAAVHHFSKVLEHPINNPVHHSKHGEVNEKKSSKTRNATCGVWKNSLTNPEVDRVC